ncbi:MAG: glycosyltransferase family 4 protein [Methanobacterium sp.]|uniref:glycosyltransferase family 4 protein n=1 Tax=Methanobacterium sp. TaxID=2164 RepID=UPI003C767D25
MKIAFIYDAVYPWVKGGAEKRVYELAKRLAERGHEVHWYSIGWWWTDNDHNDIIMEGIKLHGVSDPIDLYSDDRRSIKEALIFSLKLLKPLFKDSYDIVDCQGFPFFSCFTAKIHSTLGRSNLIITLHEVWGDYWYTYLGKPGIFGKIVERAMLGLTNNIITVSSKTQKDLKKIKKSEESIIIPNGIDFNHIKGIKPSNERSTIIFAGRLIKEKNVDVLIQSLVTVKEKIPDIICLIIGNGPELSKLEILASELQLKENIIFKDFMENYDDLIGHMKSSKVLVLPSTREGFGMVVIEANACGIPVVTVDHPMNAAVDLVIDGVNGFKTQLETEDMSDKIIKSIESQNEFHDKCIEISSEYDWEIIVDSLEKVYRTII